MNLLLDTCTMLWFLKGENLSDKIKEMIINNTNYVSVASLWEVAIKMNIGKYTFNGGFSAFVDLVANNGFEIIPIENEFMKRLFELPFIHKDPFDRLIITTALVENLIIVTADENIQKYDVNWIW